MLLSFLKILFKCSQPFWTLFVGIDGSSVDTKFPLKPVSWFYYKLVISYKMLSTCLLSKSKKKHLCYSKTSRKTFFNFLQHTRVWRLLYSFMSVRMYSAHVYTYLFKHMCLRAFLDVIICVYYMQLEASVRICGATVCSLMQFHNVLIYNFHIYRIVFYLKTLSVNLSQYVLTAQTHFQNLIIRTKV